MKVKPALLVILVVLLVGGAAVWQFVIKPIRPAWLPAPRDLTELFPNVSANTNTGVANVNASNANASVNAAPPSGREVDFPLTLPDGFRISLFAKDIANARVLAVDPNGTLLVSSPKLGKVFALPDRNADGVADEAKVVIDGLNQPHGLEMLSACQYALPKQGTDNTCSSGWLYVAENDGVSKWVYDTQSLSVSRRERLFDLPADGGHFTRTIRFGNDGKLYTTAGSSCNVCVESDERRAAMLVSDADGKNLRVFARGLRNTVFFTTNPTTGELWGADMGRDYLGDNLPPEDINVIRDGKHYGWPYCYGNRVHDDDFDKEKTFDCSGTEPPLIEMQAHSAPLGITFIPEAWGAEYDADLLISFHGSWNRSVPTGYRIVRYDLSGSAPQGPIDFLSGFLEGSGALGRPVDLLFNGSTLFVSDDKAGAIYRVTKS